MKKYNKIDKVLWPLRKAVLRLMVKTLANPNPNPWDKAETYIPKRKYGSGCIHEWPWYFDGQSNVTVNSLEDICHWLKSCQYCEDQKLFLEDDFWQHPVTFENLKKGDCEDHSLWAWRKLTEIGIHSEFIIGRIVVDKILNSTRHAFVAFEKNNERFILESVAKDKNEIVLPFEEVKNSFNPELSVDGDLKTYLYAGHLISLMKSKKSNKGRC
ncbi:MAG: transglutaminase-like cysteine peptidase [Candidatus Theseobacter exili]|nr:transglutaminase-like cysteine peptidase [Candidatus Theseobacter exili]